MTNEDISIDDYDADTYSNDYLEPADAVATPVRPNGRDGNRAQRRAADKRIRALASETTPLEREADGVALVGLEFDGETYWCPTDPADWRSEAIEAFEDGKAMRALKYMLEPDEDGKSGYALLKSKRYRMRKINELFHALGKVGGFETSGN